MSKPRVLFVTGKLAEPSLRETLAELANQVDLDARVAVLPITVIALASTSWVARHLPDESAKQCDRVILPGLCNGDLGVVAERLDCSVERGPKDLRDLPEFLGGRGKRPADYGEYDIEILAEINHAPQLALEQIVAQAQHYHDSGADVIDVGCEPGATWSGVGDAVRALRDRGFRVSIDTFNAAEARAAVVAGAELLLSVNSENVEAARDLGCEAVVIPDDLASLRGMDATIEKLSARNVRYRIDPVLEPIGFGFAASLGRYLEVRRRYPDAEIIMGVGNLTELTDVDSAGVNVMLLGFCQEIGIRSVLTTEVIPWCAGCVRELDLARRLVCHAVRRNVPPKHLEPNLIALRDPKLRELGEKELERLHEQIKDRNYRIFAEGGMIHVLRNRARWSGADPFVLLESIQKEDELSASHAFYLGYEMAKAVTALTLGKRYVQDQALRWGYLTREEQNVSEKKRKDRDPDGE